MKNISGTELNFLQLQEIQLIIRSLAFAKFFLLKANSCFLITYLDLNEPKNNSSESVPKVLC